MSIIENDHDDFTIINGQKVLKDGRTLKVRMTAMDHQTSADDLRFHRPGAHVTADAKANEARQSTYDAYVKDLGEAWRSPDPAPVVVANPTPPKDAGEKAYNAMVAGLENAWKGADA